MHGHDRSDHDHPAHDRQRRTTRPATITTPRPPTRPRSWPGMRRPARIAAVRLAFAGLSRRRLRLFAWPGMGGRGGDVRDADVDRGWLEDLCDTARRATTRSCSHAAHRAVAARDWPALPRAHDLALALAGSKERRLESAAQGARLRRGGARGLAACGAFAPCRGPRGDPVPIRSRCRRGVAGHGFPLESRLARLRRRVRRQSRLRGAFASARSARPTDSALSPRLRRWPTAMARRPHGGGPRRAGRLRFALRSRRA